jgi:CelD/BcsL family acetyltransferase involved in cellulose biosynthesis
MHKAGEVSVTNIRTREEFLCVKDDIFSVAKQSWAEKGGDSLASPGNEKFFYDLALGSAAKERLSLWTLSLNGKMIAVEFHLKAYGKEHAMRGHYLPEFASLSPGTYLEMQILKNSFEEAERVQIYDFCGSFEGYKRKWTDSFVPHCDVEVFGASPRARLIAMNETKLVPLLRHALPQGFWNNRLFKMCGINSNRMEIK